MKTIIINGLIAFFVGLLNPRIMQAQGTVTYLSNLAQSPVGTASVGSDSWFAADFITGANAGGYLLNSVQLAMTDASGDPTGFTVMIYSGPDILGANRPGSSIGSLTGSANPATGGIYTYTSSSGLALSPNTSYFIVVTAGATVANGAYGWSVTSAGSPGYNSYHWGGETLFASSSNGLSWNYTSPDYGLYALSATPATEPGVMSLFALGGLLVGFRRWKARAG